jgi:Protein of unknown function (DUF3168)
MDLEQAIHQRWAASETLESLLPAERLKTGLSPGDPMPYATLTRQGNRTTLHSNAGDAVDETTLRIDVFSDNFDAGQAIAEQVKAAFDRSSFALSGDDRVVQMRRTNDWAAQAADRVWQFAIQFLAQVHLPSGT